ncbi:MAG: hypothetical protein MUP02_01045, partial [Actinobacteria bacterium]|nr:hypothetical protein [Actinomycetota bacterium]
MESINPQGLADSHTHLWMNDGDIDNKAVTDHTGFQLLRKILSDFKRSGGSFIVDCTPYGCGRDANVLLYLSKLSGIKIISVTGFHKRKYYLNDFSIWDMDRKQATRFFLDEIQDKLREAKDPTIKAGAIKAAFTGTLEGQYLVLSLAAVEASKESGLPLIVHTEKGSNTEKLISLLKKEKMDFSRVLLCHMDKNNDKDLHSDLIDQGIFLEYDTFLRPKYDPEVNVFPL